MCSITISNPSVLPAVDTPSACTDRQARGLGLLQPGLSHDDPVQLLLHQARLHGAGPHPGQGQGGHGGGGHNGTLLQEAQGALQGTEVDRRTRGRRDKWTTHSCLLATPHEVATSHSAAVQPSQWLLYSLVLLFML